VRSLSEERARLAALADFIAGSSLSEIARRYRVPLTAAEADIRRALFDYGFVGRPVTLTGARTVGVERHAARPLSPA
jgi:hypothetical protein